MKIWLKLFCLCTVSLITLNSNAQEDKTYCSFDEARAEPDSVYILHLNCYGTNGFPLSIQKPSQAGHIWSKHT